MKATKQQLAKMEKFRFKYQGLESWFYLAPGRGADACSFHQACPSGQQNVHGLPLKKLIAALKLCGYIVLMLCLPVATEARVEIGDGHPGNVTAAEIWADQKAKHKQKKVEILYEDFLNIISIKEHSEKLRNKAVAENGVLVKLKAEQDVIIKLQAQQIEACEAIVKQHERLGETQEQISQAVERKLAELTGELTREKRLSRYKSEFIGIGALIIGVALWIAN